MTDHFTHPCRNCLVANRLACRVLGTGLVFGLPLGLLAACSDDIETSTTFRLRDAGAGASGGTGGSRSSGQGGAGQGGTAPVAGPGTAQAGAGQGSGAAGGPADAGAGDASTIPDVFRPEEVARTAALVAGLTLPAGFRINVFADELEQARMLAVHEQDVYLTRPEQGDVLRLRDADLDGVAEDRVTVASGLPLVHGITFRGADVYLATPNQVFRGTVDAQGAFGTLAVLIPDLPDGGQHGNRTLGIGPDDALYISVGSSCDACQETDTEHATLLRASTDGAQRSVFASGLRNTIGFGWHPETGVLWGMDHGSDNRGDNIPPEELNRIVAGADYGWPYCFGQQLVDPIILDPPNTTKAAHCATTLPAV
ncbi:MAG TPA: PQQ-dependent sugar dehydrogenase, partial [Polyangiaceae bacterium]|nr:PQQ-dependent sugar dehydrogenase [Polyangiaceae bacterium]